MAEEAEDVEIETPEIQEDQSDEVEQPDTDEDSEEPDEGEEETIIGFEGEEAAPASEQDSSVIRDMRLAIREKDKELARLRRAAEPKQVEVGEKPTLEGCEFDEQRYEQELTAFHDRKRKAEAQQAEAAKVDERRQAEWQERVQAYDANKVSLRVDGYDEAEAEVFAAIPNETQALIMMTDRPAALVFALSKSASNLEKLSKLDPARAAMMIGKLEDKVTVGKRKAKPQPDRGLTGKTTASGDAQLKKLEVQAAKTGDRTELIRYKRQMASA